jgi:hypothetical protein
LNDSPERRQELIDLGQVLNTQVGRRVMHRFLSLAGVYKTVLEQLPGFTASESALANGGRQNFGQRILSEILDASPESYDTMMKEARQSKLIGDKNA